MNLAAIVRAQEYGVRIRGYHVCLVRPRVIRLVFHRAQEQNGNIARVYGAAEETGKRAFDQILELAFQHVNWFGAHACIIDQRPYRANAKGRLLDWRS